MKETKYPGLYVTESGEVYSNTRGPISKLKPTVGTTGYCKISYRGKTINTHRLVAETFIDNPDNLPEVNHIDSDRTNNVVSNLEWTTTQRNCELASAKYWLIECRATGERVSVFNLAKWCEENNIDKSNLHKTRKLSPSGRQLSCKGYRIIG